MRKLHYLFFALIMGLSVSMTSCSSDNDSPIDPDPVDPTPELPVVNKTMAELQALANASAVEITEDFIFDGIVISNDTESSNFYRKLIIQNGEFGVVMSVNKADEGDSFYKEFTIGQKVIVKAKGLHIGISHGAIIIGKGADADYTVGLISNEDLKGILVKAEGGADVTPKAIAISEITDALLNTLVTIDAVQFVDADLTKNYGIDMKSDGTIYSAANRTLVNEGEESIIVRSSQYAAFAETAVAQGKGSITAIISKYNNDYQLYIRDINEVVMTGERFAVAGEPDATTGEKVYFSEYAEGSSNNKYLEIYNATGADIDLANYTVRTAPNGGEWGDVLELTGTLADKAMYVIATDQLDASVIAKANLTLSYPSPVHFNGDDAVGLFKKVDAGWSLCDVIGVQGTQEKWTVAGVAEAATDHTIIRKEAVTAGNPDWTTATDEWIVKDKDYWSSIGIRGEGTTEGGEGEGEGEGTAGINAGTYTGSAATDLFISEYLEGGSNNKYLEIYNGTGADVDLAGYSIKVASNGSTFAEKTAIVLAGTLPNGGTFLIANSSAALTLPEGKTASVEFTTATYFNGDDAIALIKGETIIDVFGVEGVDPGSAWAIGDITTATADHTLVRKATVTGPTATWDTAEWEVNDKEYATNLGSHTMN
ncbi:DUF5689 domain-containing protein [Ancylomarina sp.]|uniref:DUF5689 domain-containing protein n=1 Tax=Ancylomarina sp. TaxID=1970196 RepID=UPI003564983F